MATAATRMDENYEAINSVLNLINEPMDVDRRSWYDHSFRLLDWLSEVYLSCICTAPRRRKRGGQMIDFDLEFWRDILDGKLRIIFNFYATPSPPQWGTF